MGEKQTAQAIDSRSVEVFPNHPFVIAVTAAIEQPVATAAGHMNGRAGAEVKHLDPGAGAIRPVRDVPDNDGLREAARKDEPIPKQSWPNTSSLD